MNYSNESVCTCCSINPLRFIFYHPRSTDFIRSHSTLENHTRFQTNRQSIYPFSDQNGAKTKPDGAAHTYIACIREPPTLPQPPARIHFKNDKCSLGFSIKYTFPYLLNLLSGKQPNSKQEKAK